MRRMAVVLALVLTGALAAPAVATNHVGRHGTYAGPELLGGSPGTSIHFTFDGDHVRAIQLRNGRHTTTYVDSAVYHHAPGQMWHFSAHSKVGSWQITGYLLSTTTWSVHWENTASHRTLLFHPTHQG